MKAESSSRTAASPHTGGHGSVPHLSGVAAMAAEAADHRPVLMFNPGLIVLAVGPGACEFDVPSAQYLVRVSLMNALSLSESMPCMEKGSCLLMASSPASTKDCSLASRGTASIHRCIRRRPPGCILKKAHMLSLQWATGRSPENPVAAGPSRRRSSPECGGQDSVVACVYAGFRFWI